MKKIRFTFIFLFLLFASIYAANIPKSAKSKKAVREATLRLKPLLKEKGLTLGNPIFIRILKMENKLEVWIKKGKVFKLFKVYAIRAYSGGLGPKLKEGDRRAPEGFYFVTPSRLNPNSKYHLSFDIGYPNKYDREYNRTGKYLMVHGNQKSDGCYAMGDKNIEEIYTLIQKAFEGGQKYFRIHIFPFHMTDKNLKKFKRSKWYSFWENLKDGYEWFEKHKSPPDVTVSNKKYIFGKSN